MSGNLGRVAVVINGFVHDFATGYWLSCMLSITFLHRFQGQHPGVAELLQGVERFFLWNSVGAVAVILATGAGRTFTYVDNAFGATTEATRRRMLIIKHLILLAVFAVGSYHGYRLTFH